MPPRRRKRKVEDDEGEADPELSPNPSKKSKYSKAEKAAARERARAWHQNKNGGKLAAEAPGSGARFSTGRAPVADKRSPTPTKAIKRKTPSTSRSAGASGASTRSRKTAPDASVSRSSLKTSSPEFKFEPPEVKSEREESENEGEENNAMAIDSTVADDDESTNRTRYEFGKSDNSKAEKDEKSSRKQKKAQQLARLQKLRDERQQKGLKVASPTAAKSTIGSPDPPSSETKDDSPPMARVIGSSKPKSTKRKKSQPVAEVAGLFASSSKPKSSAHRPNRGTFNPDNPFPTEGHRMPTAAYCGCGPTPGSLASSSGRDDFCQDENVGMSLDRNSAPGGSGVDPPCARNDGQQVSGKPGPPGTNAGGNGASEPGAEPDPPAAATAVRPRQQPSSALSSAVARAKMLVSSATSANAERKERLGAAVFGDREETGESVDPPATSSKVSKTLAKFRKNTDGAEPEEEEEGTEIVAATVADQNTSEIVGDIHRVDETSNSDLTEETPKQKSFLAKLRTLLKTLLIGIMAIQIVWFLVMAASGRIDTSPEERSADAGSDANGEVKNSCFVDYPAGDFDAGEDVHADDACVGNYVQCPLWGTCRDGELVDCNDGGGKMNDMVRFVVSAGGDSCVPSDETLILSLAVEEALLSMSASQTCGEAYHPDEIRVNQDDSYPLFSLNRVVNYMAALDRNDAISLDTVLWAHPAFDETVIRFGSLSGSDNDDFDAVGLGGGVSPSALNLPLRCQTRLLLWELLGYFISALYYLGSWLVSFSFDHPYISAVILATTKLMSIFQGKRKHRRRVNDLFEPVKEQAYDLLAESLTAEGYAALLLRDDVTHIMFSNNVDREFVNAFVWPKVVHDVRRDNRVRKFRKHHGGKELEHWELARVSALSRKARKSGSTPVPAPGNLLNATASNTAPRDP